LQENLSENMIEPTSKSSLFHNRMFQAIVISGLFLQTGIWIRNFAVLLFVMEKTNGDAFAVSMISVAEFTPIFIFSFIGGTFADRWRPKLTMVWCDILSALSVFVVLLTLFLGTWKVVFIATLISAILSQFSQPSSMKLFKMHLPMEQMQQGMSVYQTVFGGFVVIGPMIGTFVYQSFGINASIAVTGIAFLLSAVALAFLPADREMDEDKTKATLWQDMKLGIKYVVSRKTLTLLGLCFMAAGLAIGFIHPLSIFIITENLGLPKENLQWLFMVNGIGMTIGGMVAMVFASKVPPQRLLVFGMLVNGICFAILGISTNLWITLAAEFFCGFMMPCIHIGMNTLILQKTEEAFVGRVNGILSPLFAGSMVVTMSAAGLLKEQFSLTATFVAAGFLFLLGVMAILPLYNLKAEPKLEQVLLSTEK
jgi:MFS family permease